MATTGLQPVRYSSSPELSDPPSMLSAPTSPTGFGRPKAQGGELDEIVVDPNTIRYDTAGLPLLTKDGHPRRKPGPKPGSRIKRNSTNPDEGTEKPKRARKPKDPNAPPTQRKRKTTVPPDGEGVDTPPRAVSMGITGIPVQAIPRQSKITEMTNPMGRFEATPQREPKRESLPGSMSNILNAEPERDPYHQQRESQAPSRPSITPRTSGTAYDPIRSSNYDPIRETMVTHSYPNTMGSPRGPTTSNVINRASASPSIASLVDPPVQQKIISPVPSHNSFALGQQQSLVQGQVQSRQNKESASTSVPASPNPFRRDFIPPPAPKPQAPPGEMRKPAMPLSTLAASNIQIRPTSITTIGAGAKRSASKKDSATSSSPRMHPSKDSLETVPGANGRSILDFGKAEPGAELVVPSIILNIPLNGETNKYINFMRMAEDQYGWDALHPRQAEHKARKARIAAASAALAVNDSSREGDEMSVDESDNDDSNIEMGGTSGPDKPVKKKRHFKEDEYDKEDDFVDDSEMLWEEQAAASRDGFFVYSGPLVPEVEKPEPGRGDGLPKRGRGSRGGRGGSRGAGTGTGRGRGGGPGSRGGITRKPRMTKADRQQMDREKADREAAFLQQTNGSSYNVLQPSSPKFAVITQALAANGAKVYITGRRAKVLESSAKIHGSAEKLGESGGSIVPLVMDVNDKESIKNAVTRITELEEGGVNILVNNAGVWKGRPSAGPAAGPEAFSAAMLAEEAEDWRQAMDTNTIALYFVTAAFLPLLAKAVNGPAKQRGSVINNASVSGLLRVTQRQQYSYNISSGAIHVGRQMAFDFGHENIDVRVNTIALGYFPSEMTAGPSDENNENTFDIEKFRGMMKALGTTMVKRLGSPRDMASAILTLAVNDYMHGTVMILDGGSALSLPSQM
ncbi:hypothetical protein F5Y18DRAFT_433034 [Xylariaceae sp. FL1019]|nr:hypothetical protein F5Y18DRAFT_433034 [Xylariaceae sp. FL1019]